MLGTIGSIGGYAAAGLAGLYGWASNVYSYNREAWMTDIQLRQAYDYQFDNMNISTHGMSREEVRDRTQATITKLSNYILVTTLILALAAEILVEGRIPVECADFILNVYMLCMGTAVLYLVLSILFGIVASNEIYESSARLLTSRPPPWKKIDENMKNRADFSLRTQAFEEKPWYEILRPPLWKRVDIRRGFQDLQAGRSSPLHVSWAPELRDSTSSQLRRDSQDSIRSSRPDSIHSWPSTTPDASRTPGLMPPTPHPGSRTVSLEEGGKSPGCFEMGKRPYSSRTSSSVSAGQSLLGSERRSVSAEVSATVHHALNNKDDSKDTLIRQVSYSSETAENANPKALEEIRCLYDQGWKTREEVWKPLETLSFQCMALGVKNLLDVYGYLCMAFLYSVYKTAFAFWAVMFIFTALNVILMEFLFPNRCLWQTLLVGLVPVGFAVAATTPYLFLDRAVVPFCYVIHFWLHWRLSRPSLSQQACTLNRGSCMNIEDDEELEPLLTAISTVRELQEKIRLHEPREDPVSAREFAEEWNAELTDELMYLQVHSALVAGVVNECRRDEPGMLQFEKEDLVLMESELEAALARFYPHYQETGCYQRTGCSMRTNGSYQGLYQRAGCACLNAQDAQQVETVLVEAEEGKERRVRIFANVHEAPAQKSALLHTVNSGEILRQIGNVKRVEDSSWVPLSPNGWIDAEALWPEEFDLENPPVSTPLPMSRFKSSKDIEVKRKNHAKVGPTMMLVARYTTLSLWFVAVGWAVIRAVKAEGYSNGKALFRDEFSPPLADIKNKPTRWPSPYFQPHSLVCPTKNSVFMADQFRVFQRLNDDSVRVYDCVIDGTIADISADCDAHTCWPIVLLRRNPPTVMDCSTGKQYPLLQVRSEAQQFAVVNSTTLLAAHHGNIVQYQWNPQRGGWAPSWVVADMGNNTLEALDVTNNKMLAFRKPGVVELQDLNSGMRCGVWLMPPAVVGAGCAHDNTVYLFVEEMSHRSGPTVKLVQAEMGGPQVCKFKADKSLLRDRFAFPNHMNQQPMQAHDQAYMSRDDDMPRYGDDWRTQSPKQG